MSKDGMNTLWGLFIAGLIILCYGAGLQYLPGQILGVLIVIMSSMKLVLEAK